MKSITQLMAWGLRLKSQPQDKKKNDKAPEHFSIWINKPRDEVEKAARVLLDDRWRWDLSSDRAGTSTRLSVFETKAEDTGALPRGLAFRTQLRDIKSLMETGETPSVEGQAHGKRSMVGGSMEELIVDGHWHYHPNATQADLIKGEGI